MDVQCCCLAALTLSHGDPPPEYKLTTSKHFILPKRQPYKQEIKSCWRRRFLLSLEQSLASSHVMEATSPVVCSSGNTWREDGRNLASSL